MLEDTLSHSYLQQDSSPINAKVTSMIICIIWRKIITDVTDVHLHTMCSMFCYRGKILVWGTMVVCVEILNGKYLEYEMLKRFNFKKDNHHQLISSFLLLLSSFLHLFKLPVTKNFKIKKWCLTRHTLVPLLSLQSSLQTHYASGKVD